MTPLLPVPMRGETRSARDPFGLARGRFGFLGSTDPFGPVS